MPVQMQGLFVCDQEQYYCIDHSDWQRGADCWMRICLTPIVLTGCSVIICSTARTEPQTKC